jgi:membrane protein implicated in regulation of membrane protease activity
LLQVFIGCLAFGVLFSAFSLIFGAHGFDHGDFDHGGAGGHSGSDSADVPSPFNPLVISSAITAFGAVGLIAKTGFGMADILSAVVALGFAGVIGALIFFGIVKFMYGSQSNSVFSLNDLVNTEAEVITPIPANGMGEIAYVANGVRYNLSARSSDGEDIARGTTVIIREVAGNAAYVQRRLTLDDISLPEEAEEERARRNLEKQ